MLRFLLCLVLLAGMQPAWSPQNNLSSHPSHLTLVLPLSIASESVQIEYFMTGPFGGYGGFVRASKGQAAYDIITAVDGKRAATLKVIAYMPGCEIVKLEIPLTSHLPPRPLHCKPLKTVVFRGQIYPSSFIQEHHPSEVEVNYLATWGHQFFGISDGFVTPLNIASVLPDEYGRFEVALPDFASQYDLGEAQLQLILRHPKTGNIIAFLRPMIQGVDTPAIRVSNFYPAITQFSAKEP